MPQEVSIEIIEIKLRQIIKVFLIVIIISKIIILAINVCFYCVDLFTLLKTHLFTLAAIR